MIDVLPRDELIAAHENFVRKVVQKTIKALGLPSESVEEYESAGYLGLVEAADRYDPKSEIPFERYAFFRVRGAIVDYIREHSDLTGQAYRYAKTLQAVEGIEAEATALACNEKYPRKALARIFSFAAKGAISYRLASQEAQVALDQLADETATPEESMISVQQAIQLRSLVQTLPEKERFIIEGYYFYEKSFMDLTRERPELSKSWISRLHSRALSLLGKKLMGEYVG